MRRQATTRWTFGACAVVVGLVSVTSETSAGGFDRYDQDVSLLFESGATVVDVLGSYVITDSHYDGVDGQREVAPLIADFWAGSIRIKFTPSQDTACLLHAGQPFGSDVDHGPNWSRADVVTDQYFRVSETGLTCSYRFGLGSGYVRAIAGLTADQVDFEQHSFMPSVWGTKELASLRLNGSTVSWRAGLAYEVPTTGLLATLVYYAPVSFDLDGSVSAPGLTALGQPLPVHSDVEFPQAIEARVSMFLSPGYLGAAYMKWSDWSQLDVVEVKSGALPITSLNSQFKDGLTIGVLFGVAISDDLSAWARVSWDRGVTSGWTEHTDSWSLFTGLKYRLTPQVELSANLGLIWLDAGEINTTGRGGPYDATFPTEIAIVPQLGMTTRF